MKLFIMGNGYPTWLLVSLFFALTNYAHASSLVCNTTDACSNYRGGIAAVEVPAGSRKELALGGRSLQVKVVATACWYLGQRVQLFVTNDRKQPVLWGYAEVLLLEKNEAELTATLDVYDLSITDSILAADCQGHCDRVIDQLPAPSSQQVLVDLRPQNLAALMPIPGSQHIAFNLAAAPASFPFARLQDSKDLPLVFIATDNRLQQAGLLSLFKTFKEKGFKQIWWYYPGGHGFRGIRFPNPAIDVPLITPRELAANDPHSTNLLFVGLTQDYRNLRVGQLSSTSASYNPNAKIKPQVTPFARRGNPTTFLWPAKMPAKSNIVVVYEKDAADTYKFQAAEALMSMGYTNVKVLRGGAAQLREAQLVAP